MFKKKKPVEEKVFIPLFAGKPSSVSTNRTWCLPDTDSFYSWEIFESSNKDGIRLTRKPKSIENFNMCDVSQVIIPRELIPAVIDALSQTTFIDVLSQTTFKVKK